MKQKIRIYVAHAMTGKMKDELVAEARITTQALEAAGYEVLDPITEEHIDNVHEPLVQLSAEQLERYWRRDKEMIKEADLVLDYKACNRSDGVAKELGYARFCLWKPVVRVFPGMGINISRIEDDIIVDTLEDAIQMIGIKFPNYEAFREWRQEMWDRCFFKWVAEQNRMNERYGVKVSETSPSCLLNVK